jgi:hypothetical protein
LEALEGMVIVLYGEVLNAVAALINRWGSWGTQTYVLTSSLQTKSVIS